MKVILTLSITISLCLSSFAKKNKGDAAKKRHNQRMKEMKFQSRGEHRHVLAWTSLYEKIAKKKQRIKNRIN